MFTLVKIRDGLARDDYKDPGWYKHPDGSVAYEWGGDRPASERAPSKTPDGASSSSSSNQPLNIKRGGAHEQ